MIRLTTKRTIIRDHCIDDLRTHHELFSDKKVMYYLDDIATNSFQESKENLMKSISEIENLDRKLYFLRIVEKNNHHHIGEIGYTVTDFTPVGKFIGIGYFIRQEYWNQGYVTEALAEIFRFAFLENNVYRIACGCYKENVASERVMIKCGMVKEADFKEYVWHDGKLKDRVEYRLLKPEWESQHLRV